SLPSGGSARRAAIVAATAAFVLAMLSKPSAVVAPLLGACLWLALPATKRGSSGAYWAGLAPLALWAGLAVPAPLIARAVQPAATGFDSPLWARPLVALDALAFYVSKLVLPLGLAVDYGRSPDYLATTPWIWWTWTVPVVLAACVVLARRRAP